MSSTDIHKFRIESINPILNVADMSVSLDFYVGKLGFKNAEWGNDHFTSIHRDNSCIYLCNGTQGQPGTWLWVGFDGNIFELYDELKSKGVIIRQPPCNCSWAMEMHVEDPDGHVLRFGTDPDYSEPFLDVIRQTER